MSQSVNQSIDRGDGRVCRHSAQQQQCVLAGFHHFRPSPPVADRRNRRTNSSIQPIESLFLSKQGAIRSQNLRPAARRHQRTHSQSNFRSPPTTSPPAWLAASWSQPVILLPSLPFADSLEVGFLPRALCFSALIPIRPPPTMLPASRPASWQPLGRMTVALLLCCASWLLGQPGAHFFSSLPTGCRFDAYIDRSLVLFALVFVFFLRCPPPTEH